MTSWFRQRRRWPRKPLPPRPSCCPCLERLEDRCLLSAGLVQTNLVSDVPGVAPVTDPNLVNPWGISLGSNTAFWLGENGAGVSDLLTGNGQQLPLVVGVPGANGVSGTPTGTVFNDGPGFQITQNGISGPARFLFVTVDGTLSAWNPQVNDTQALMVVDNSSQGADYMGMAIAKAGSQPYLYVADFGRGSIDVFDQNFNPVQQLGAFQDPSLPSGYAPFNVATINDQLFVAYAQKDASGKEGVPGQGHGFLDVFSLDGSLTSRFASQGPLDSPWGMTLAPASFGSFGGDLLVGNNGDGHINAYDPTSGAFLGQLTDSSGSPIAISGLWGLTFGNDHLAGNSHTLFFAAGIDQEQHGLFGAIQTPQDVAGGTSGLLPYNPTAFDDDYPLPPAQGPALASDLVASPASILLPSSSSSLALAPTFASILTPRADPADADPGLSETTVPASADLIFALTAVALVETSSLNAESTAPASGPVAAEMTFTNLSTVGVTGPYSISRVEPSLALHSFIDLPSSSTTLTGMQEAADSSSDPNLILVAERFDSDAGPYPENAPLNAGITNREVRREESRPGDPQQELRGSKETEERAAVLDAPALQEPAQTRPVRSLWNHLALGLLLSITATFTWNRPYRVPSRRRTQLTEGRKE